MLSSLRDIRQSKPGPQQSQYSNQPVCPGESLTPAWTFLGVSIHKRKIELTVKRHLKVQLSHRTEQYAHNLKQKEGDVCVYHSSSGSPSPGPCTQKQVCKQHAVGLERAWRRGAETHYTLTFLMSQPEHQKHMFSCLLSVL